MQELKIKINLLSNEIQDLKQKLKSHSNLQDKNILNIHSIGFDKFDKKENDVNLLNSLEVIRNKVFAYLYLQNGIKEHFKGLITAKIDIDDLQNDIEFGVNDLSVLDDLFETLSDDLSALITKLKQ